MTTNPKLLLASIRVLSVALLLVVAGIVFFALRIPENDAELVTLSSISIPEEVEAGTSVSIDAVAEVEGGTAQVFVQNAFGRMRFDMPISSGVGRLDLPSPVTEIAGVITVTSGDVEATLTVTPGDVAEVVAPLVGPRTIVADGADTSLAVVLPIDQYGNQVADRTPVDVEWQQPATPGSVANATVVATETENGMASVLLPSGQIAGPATVRTTARTSSGQMISGAAVRIDEVPGVVSSIALVATDSIGIADGRSLVEVESEALFDAFGNQLADGTAAQFVFDGPAGQGVVPGTVQNGRVRIELVAPDKPGELTGHIELHGMVSNEVTIEFSSAIAGFEARIERVDSDVVLRIGPALDPDGAFVADGTEVRWGEQTTQTRRGTAEIWLPAALVPTIIPTVEILGLEQLPTGEPS